MADDRLLNVFASAQVGCLRLEIKQADAHDGAGLAAERGVGLDRGGRRCKGRAERNEECCRKEAKGFHEGAEAEALAQPTAVLISGDDRKTDDEGFRAHGSTLAQELERHTPFIGGTTNRLEERGLPHSSIRMNSEASCGWFCEGEIPFRTSLGRSPERLVVLQEFYATQKTSMSNSPTCFRGR